MNHKRIIIIYHKKFKMKMKFKIKFKKNKKETMMKMMNQKNT